MAATGLWPRRKLTVCWDVKIVRGEVLLFLPQSGDLRIPDEFQQIVTIMSLGPIQTEGSLTGGFA